MIPHVSLKFYRKNGKVTIYPYSTRINRLYHRLRHELFASVDVKVRYGKKECNLGDVCEFYNDGRYDNRQEAVKALRQFLEV